MGAGRQWDRFGKDLGAFGSKLKNVNHLIGSRGEWSKRMPRYSIVVSGDEQELFVSLENLQSESAWEGILPEDVIFGLERLWKLKLEFHRYCPKDSRASTAPNSIPIISPYKSIMNRLC